MKVTEAVEAALWDDEYSQGRQEFVGLSNQGATCYLNSLLQALFMLPEFRSAVWACDVGSGGGIPVAGPDMSDEELAVARDLLQDSIPRQMQLLFARLQLGIRRAVGTVNVTRSFGWGNVRPLPLPPPLLPLT
jgi:ubiquitin carboxyl-terminal hydrolase 47